MTETTSDPKGCPFLGLYEYDDNEMILHSCREDKCIFWDYAAQDCRLALPRKETTP
jgi:hypothetical protein